MIFKERKKLVQKEKFQYSKKILRKFPSYFAKQITKYSFVSCLIFFFYFLYHTFWEMLLFLFISIICTSYINTFYPKHNLILQYYMQSCSCEKKYILSTIRRDQQPMDEEEQELFSLLFLSCIIILHVLQLYTQQSYTRSY